MSIVEVESRGAVRWIWLNRPERMNAIDTELGRRLLQEVLAAAAAEDVRAIVLAGRGRAFCAGDDLREPSRPRSSVHSVRRQDYLMGDGRWPQISRALVTAPKPTIAMLHGHAHGAGWDLALSCDFRLASESLQASHAYIRRGLASGISRLPAFVGLGTATELLMQGVRLTSVRALELGLVSRVFPDPELEAETVKFASELASAPTLGLGLIKEALSHAYEPGHDTRMWIQAGIAADSLVTRDAEEGRKAFSEKRDPVFEGR
jgi:enoyl-CoA hydratase/carnithine racemase